MKTNRSLALALLGLSALALQRLTAFAQGTAFTYQGRLSSSGASANGFYDLVFTIYDLPTGPGAFANQTNSATPVSNGLFTVTLDFGPGIFTGAGRWLEIAARTNGGGAFTTLAPRQELTPSPYAITAGNVVSNGLASGPYSAAVTFNNAANSFTGNGVGLTGVNAATVGGVGSNGFWRTTGNAGTTPGLNFLGTTDNQALAVKVNNTVALQIKPGATLPNLVGGLGGFRSSVLAPGVSGAVIVGGNAPSGGVSGFGGGDFQAVYDNDGTVGGGFGNKVGSDNADLTDGAFASVAGGVFNSAANYAATVAGGDGNFAGGQRSFIGGGYANQAQASFSAAGGGLLNSISANADYAIIGGGSNNSIAAFSTYGTIGGGRRNTILSDSQGATISGGISNSMSSSIASTIAGGFFNGIGANSEYSAIGGGYDNNVATNSGYANIAGGGANDIGANSGTSAIGGGWDNNVAENSGSATIAGGSANDIGTGAYSSAIGGGNDNNVAANSPYATIAGGNENDIGAYSASSTIGGGYNNNVADNSLNATIAGGHSNDIGANAGYNSIGGGADNNIGANSWNATITGGYLNDIGTNSSSSAIGGGWDNNIAANSYYAAIAGGYLNDIGAGSSSSVIGGGENNNVATNSDHATIAGGYLNDIGANSLFGAISGGRDNNVAANSGAATIAGGAFNDIDTSSAYSAIGGGFDNTAMLVYFGTYTGAKSKGIYLSRLEPGTGRLSAPELAAETKSPSFLAVHPSGRFLYAVGEMSSVGGNREGAVSAFGLEAATGKLTFLNQQASGGVGPCHVSLDRTGKWALVANYGSGSIAALPVGPDGKLGPSASTIQHTGSSVDRARQAGPHAHFITTDHDNRFALACDLGLDKVLVYRLGSEGAPALVANDPPSASLKAGSGPRHLAFHPGGKWVCVINEMGSTLTEMTYDARRGKLEEVQTISTLPEGFTGQNSCAEVQVHPSGKFVYGSNRGNDSIAVFAVDEKTGRLSYVEHQPTGGKTPRFIGLEPSGRWLLAANQGSDNIVVFAVDGKSGRLKPTGQTLEVGAPVCAVFVAGK